MSPNNNSLISLTSVSNLRLEQFRTQHELARNFYDDQEFCPIYYIEEVTEHRERIQKRTSPYPSPSHSPPPSYYVSHPTKNSHHRHQQYHHQNSSSPSIASASSTTVTRAIPIIDPSNMTPVSVPTMQQQPYPTKANNTTSPSMSQWTAYKNSSAISSTSPTSSNSSISSMSSSSISSISSYSATNNSYNHYYGNNNCAINYNNQQLVSTTTHYQQQQQPTIMPVVARAIPIIDPATRQVFRQQQADNIPGFYNVSVY